MSGDIENRDERVAPETLLGINIGLAQNLAGTFLLSDNAFHMIRGERRRLTVEAPSRSGRTIS